MVFSNTSCILARTLTVAFARGSSVASTSSGDTHDLTFRIGVEESSAKTASRSRATVNAANISPVPLKKQSRAGTSTLKSRGEPSERAVDPMIERVLEDGGRVVEALEVSEGSCTDVMIMWGML